MCIYCGHFSLFFHQPASLLTSYISSLPPPPHLSLSPAHHWQLDSPVREPSVWTGQRANCTSWPSDAFIDVYKHLNHTDLPALGSHSVSGILWWPHNWCEKCGCVCVSSVWEEESVWLERSLLVLLLSFGMALNLEQHFCVKKKEILMCLSIGWSFCRFNLKYNILGCVIQSHVSSL